jgi:hypothetical protein
MNKMIKYSLLALAIGALAVSCADYNETSGFTAEPDPTAVLPYTDLGPVKSYINSEKYPNMSLGVQLKVADFNKQELAHAAAITNFNNVTFGTTLMSGAIVSDNGIMNFLSMMDLLTHVQEINGEVYGSPIAANANQADGWIKTLTAPIEIKVDYVDGKEVDFNEMPTGSFPAEKGTATIAKYDGQNCLKINTSANVRIIDGFEVDSLATYTTTFWAKSDKDAEFNITFSGKKVDGAADGKWPLKAGKWTKIVVESKSDPEVTDGYLRIENTRKALFYVQKVQVGYYPDNHRPQTEEEINDTIHYALNTWCDGLMKYNEGRIKSFDLIDEAIDTKSAEVAPGVYDIKHGTEDKIFWQDIFGSEEYALTVSKVAKEAYEKYGGDPAALKFFISETGLENQKTFESLNYWIGKWEAKGAKIDGINAKLTLTYSENATVQADNYAKITKLLDNLAATGKLVRLSNFDIKYKDAEGNAVTVENITADQRQKLADYYGQLLKTYMTKIPNEKQAGICKSNMVDTTADPVGLWSLDAKKDWVRNATYKAFCDALSGK